LWVPPDKAGILFGDPGTGKTATVGALLRQLLEGLPGSLQLNKHEILFCAPTNRAVQVGLNALAKHGVTTIQGWTIARLLGLREHTDPSGKQHFKPVKEGPAKLDPAIRLLVIDEASMIGRELLGWLVDMLQSAPLSVHVLFIGDPNQLPPVGEDRSPVFTFSDNAVERWKLTEVVRHQGPILKAAQRVLHQPTGRPSFHDLADGESLEVVPTSQRFYRLFRKEIAQDPEAGGCVQLLAWRNKTVDKAAGIARRTLFGANAPRIVDGELLVATNPVYASGDEGDTDIVASTSSRLRVLSSRIKTVFIGGSNPLKVYETCALDIDADEFITFNVVHDDHRRAYEAELRELARFIRGVRDPEEARQLWREEYYPAKRWDAPVRSASAMTVHRAQGSTINTVFLDLQDIDLARRADDLFRRLVYTGLTRASKRLVILDPTAPLN